VEQQQQQDIGIALEVLAVVVGELKVMKFIAILMPYIPLKIKLEMFMVPYFTVLLPYLLV